MSSSSPSFRFAELRLRMAYGVHFARPRMRFYQLPKSQWESFFDDLSGRIGKSRRVDVEVAGTDLGDQIALRDVSLSGLTFDRGSNSFYVYTDARGGSADHAIAAPREIWVEIAASGLHRIVVLDRSRRKHILVVREPVALPPSIEDEMLLCGSAEEAASMSDVIP